MFLDLGEKVDQNKQSKTLKIFSYIFRNSSNIVYYIFNV